MKLQKIHKQLSDVIKQTITQLCKGKLQYNDVFTVETFIGISIDHKDGFFLTFKDAVYQNENTNNTYEYNPLGKRLEYSQQINCTGESENILHTSEEEVGYPKTKKQKLTENCSDTLFSNNEYCSNLSSSMNTNEYISVDELQSSRWVTDNPNAILELEENKCAKEVKIEEDNCEDFVENTGQLETGSLTQFRLTNNLPQLHSIDEACSTTMQNSDCQTITFYITHNNFTETVITLSKMDLTMKTLRNEVKEAISLKENSGLKLQWYNNTWNKWINLKELQGILHFDIIKLKAIAIHKRNMSNSYENPNEPSVMEDICVGERFWSQSSGLSGIGIKRTTVQNWQSDLDPFGEWLFHVERGGMVTSVYCNLCRKYESNLKILRNFSTTFLKGISGPSLKKDNCNKHAKSSMHEKAVSLKEEEDLQNRIKLGESSPLSESGETDDNKPSQSEIDAVDRQFGTGSDSSSLQKL